MQFVMEDFIKNPEESAKFLQQISKDPAVVKKVSDLGKQILIETAKVVVNGVITLGPKLAAISAGLATLGPVGFVAMAAIALVGVAAVGFSVFKNVRNKTSSMEGNGGSIKEYTNEKVTQLLSNLVETSQVRSEPYKEGKFGTLRESLQDEIRVLMEPLKEFKSSFMENSVKEEPVVAQEVFSKNRYLDEFLSQISEEKRDGVRNLFKKVIELNNDFRRDFYKTTDIEKKSATEINNMKSEEIEKLIKEVDNLKKEQDKGPSTNLKSVTREPINTALSLSI
ncbi:hypothetical protein BIY23_00595 [Wolbachia pipientis]|uniref:Uncharacterized protein n=1 Tax=Wolbachia pipientis TaxID=955 RepID=A0A1E7QKH6_WOLPI|nr:hypothetical protein BIY23_00595 [Wolbachia pipientis]